MDDFKDLWQTAPIDKDAPPAPTMPVALNQEAVQKIIAKQDFSSAITPEQLTAIAAGGEDAQKAFASAMNQVAQQVMLQSTMVNSKLNEQAIAQAIKVHGAAIPDLVKQHSVTSHATDTNPMFNNPAIKPVIEATQSALTGKFPNASPAEITKMTQDYIVQMGQAFAPKPEVTPNAPGDFDWSTFENTPT